MTFAARPLNFDVGDVIGEEASLAATYYPARTGAEALGLLVCLPGGTYSRDYWDLHIPARHGYSFAEFATGNGYAVITIDPLGTAESSQPTRDFGFSDIAAALSHAVRALPAVTGIDAPPVAMAHSLGGYLAITQQALFSSFAALIDAPVLIGYGVVDVSPDPRAEAGLYRRCPDITTLVLADSAHCHNMASSRHRLWRRLLDWAATVTFAS